MTADPQAMFIVEYPCDRFCRIELDVSGERSQLTLQQMREKADGLHRRAHAQEHVETQRPVVDEDAAGRPAATVFLSAPNQGRDRRR